MTRMVDRKGHVYGYLTVTELHPRRNESGRVVWKCECRCGNKVLATGTNLHQGCVSSCGCKHLETLKKKKLARMKQVQDTHSEESVSAAGV
jgi:hypothetical protein